MTRDWYLSYAEIITTNRKAAALFKHFPTYKLVFIIVSFDIKQIKDLSA